MATEDYYEAMSFHMDVDDFESRYADEMDAMREMEDEISSETLPPKSKRCLDFGSVPEKISSNETFLEGAEGNKVSDEDNTKMKITKRDNSHLDNSPTADSAFNDDLCRKRPRTADSTFLPSSNTDSDLELTKVPLSNDTDSTDCLQKPCFSRHQFPKENWSLLSVKSSIGIRVFLRYKEEDTETEETFHLSGHRRSLLSVPVASLRHMLEVEREKKLMEQGDDSPNVQSSVETSLLNGIDSEASEDGSKVKSTLWVDRYRPQSYMELLSDEGVNRTLLQWLKLWDKVAFGREPRKRLKKDKKETQKNTTQSNFNKPWELSDELDDHGRPQFKIALLSGPPGLGKTTLAHVIACHAGYNVVEMNASDDRSPEFFSNQLEAATQMRAVLGQNPRPNCLVIDEIDGAPAPSINLLVSMVKSNAVPGKKRKKGEFPILLRPIICICNDQYTPAMKPLRQVSLVLNFPPTLSSRLASRLLEVSRNEKLLADMAALLVLCEKAENDIRSCLSTLQFIHNQKNTVSLLDLQKISVGQKDVQKSMFSVWQEIFQIPRVKRKRPAIRVDQEMHLWNGLHSSEQKEVENSSLSGRFRNILHTSQSCGDYEKQIQGMFENYLNINFKDPRLEALQNGVEWLCFSDILNQEISSTQLYILMPYIPYTAVAFHLYFSALTYPKISYPHTFFEFKNKGQQMQNMLNSTMSEVSVFVKRFINSTSAILDLLPCLQNIIKPMLRPVNIQLYSHSEKAELANVINIMIAYNLSYRQERSIEGQYQYLLEPNIEELISFPGLKPQRILTYAAKQLIAREVEVEKMHRHESKSHEKERMTTQNAPIEKATVANHKQTLQPKSIVDEKPSVDFFGRKLQVPSVEKKSEMNPSSREAEIWFRFKEGYSNAVRKTIRIADLM